MHLITEGTGQEGTWYSPWLRDITWADFCSWKNSGVWQSGTEEPTLGWELKDLDFLSDSATLFLCDLTLNYFLSLLLCFLTCKNERGCEDLYVSFHPIQTMTDRWMARWGTCQVIPGELECEVTDVGKWGWPSIFTSSELEFTLYFSKSDRLENDYKLVRHSR